MAMDAVGNDASAQAILAQLTAATALQRERGALKLQRLLRGEPQYTVTAPNEDVLNMMHGSDVGANAPDLLQITVCSQNIGNCSRAAAQNWCCRVYGRTGWLPSP